MLMPSIFGETFMDDFFSDWDRDFNAHRPAPAGAVMKTDIKEKENTYELGIELPGYAKEDVQAELKDGYLIVTAKRESRNDKKDEKKDKYIRRERYFGTCSRSFYVGKDMRHEDIKARFENGILYLDIPKHVEKPVEEKKFIQIAG